MKWALLAMTALTACSGYKMPAFSDPQGMSGETLCYRQAYAKTDPGLNDEVKARNLDCGKILESQRRNDEL